MVDRRRGFTLIEIIIVMVLIGIVFGIAIPRIERLSPKYAMRSAARKIASQLEYVRSNSVFRRKTYGLLYELGRKTYWVLVPPEGGDPDMPWEDWPRLNPVQLPALVKFHAIVLADNSMQMGVDGEDVIVFMDPMGATGSHVVVLEDADGRIMSVKFNALSGTADFFQNAVGFARYD